MNTPAPFSQVLRAECQKDWQAAIQHRFVDEIFAGTLSSEHLRHYLVQDYQFVDRFVALLGAAIASADQYAARVRFSQFAAMITSDENTYFQRCFDLLRVPAIERSTPTLDDVTLQFQELMHEAAETRRYASALAVLCHPNSSTPNGSRCTPTTSSVISWPGCAANWIVSAQPSPSNSRTRHAASSIAPWHWKKPSSTRSILNAESGKETRHT